MCDYSLHAVESRPAQIADKLISTSFRRSSTNGFAAQDHREVAVCLLPGTELAFDEDVKFYHRWIWAKSTGFRVARFCSVDAHRSPTRARAPPGAGFYRNLGTQLSRLGPLA